jgi:hypothetical protein
LQRFCVLQMTQNILELFQALAVYCIRGANS